LLTTTYRPGERFRAQAVNEFAVFGSQALASVLAGPAITYLGWKALNLAGAPLLIAMALSLLALREPARSTAEIAGARGE
jgi:MFS family permease